ncbi:MAG TPA: hypothetical protein DEQ20_07045 [Desulfobulbaceae bacterium]|nr:MAG: hypothetical protein A2520_00060 [Deltaproteobacteria bacterium RIFOXYD12_FULL_53_23]HCC54664.1 hypothetical protein [Desulfobulbaceae bacterium]
MLGYSEAFYFVVGLLKRDVKRWWEITPKAYPGRDFGADGSLRRGKKRWALREKRSGKEGDSEILMTDY